MRDVKVEIGGTAGLVRVLTDTILGQLFESDPGGGRWHSIEFATAITVDRFLYAAHHATVEYRYNGGDAKERPLCGAWISFVDRLSLLGHLSGDEPRVAILALGLGFRDMQRLTAVGRAIPALTELEKAWGAMFGPVPPSLGHHGFRDWWRLGADHLKAIPATMLAGMPVFDTESMHGSIRVGRNQNGDLQVFSGERGKKEEEGRLVRRFGYTNLSEYLRAQHDAEQLRETELLKYQAAGFGTPFA